MLDEGCTGAPATWPPSPGSPPGPTAPAPLRTTTDALLSVPTPAVRFLPESRQPHHGLRAFVAVGLGLALGAASAGSWLPDRPGPPAGLEEQATVLGAPPDVPAVEGGYAFTRTQADGSGPVAYSPCRPIHYVVREDGAPQQGAALVATALARISEATGLVFVDDGTTDEAPSADRDAYQPDRYGERWAPVLIAWATEEEVPGLAGSVAGIAGSAAVTDGDLTVYVTGGITLDARDIARLSRSANGASVALGVITHEMGHLVGLDHVGDQYELMYPRTSLSVTSFQDGDRAGLARLGRGRCAPGI